MTGRARTRALSRLLAIAVAALVISGAGGFAAGELLRPEPKRIAGASPLPATSPSAPIDPPVDVLPDPGIAPLATALPLSEEQLGYGLRTMRVPAPEGWTRTEIELGEWTWEAPHQLENTYLMRVKIVSSQRLSVATALAQRLEALESVTDEFDLESRTADTFVATYVSRGYRRLTMDRFLSLGSDTAYAQIALTGRVVDRAGMADLLDRVTQGASH
ncbi:hypothetical protein [Nocardioides pacificus]